MMYFKRNWPWIVGAVLTLVIAIFAYLSALQPACYETSNGIINCPTKWFYLKQSTPNELGDTLAGFAGALAFIWIIVTVAMQSMELSEQRKEFEKMADAQAEQVDLLVKQGAIFADEQKQRDEERARREFEELLKSIDFNLPRVHSEVFSEEENDLGNSKHYVQLPSLDVGPFEKRLLEYVHNTADFIQEFRQKFSTEGSTPSRTFTRRRSFEQVVNLILDIEKIYPRLEEAQKIRVNALRLPALKANLQTMLKEQIWEAEPVHLYKEPRFK